MKSNKYQEETFEKYLRGEISLEEEESYIIEDEKEDEKEDERDVKDDEYDPLALISRTISSDFDSSVFETIDDSDLPLASNWLDFCINSKYLNFKPYPKQIKFGLELFSDYCPDCSDPDIMNDLFNQPLQEILDRVQLLHHGKCLKCHKTRSEFVEEGKLHFYNELAGCAGQRGGKAQPLYSLIKTPGGWTRMGDIKIGDLVSTPDGKTAPVTDIFPQGIRPTYRITFEDGRTTDCDENHLWKVFNEHWKRRCTRKKEGGYNYPKTDNPWKVFSLKEIINRKSKYPLFIPLLKEVYNDKKDLLIDPYVLGCLLGDGNFTSSSVKFTNIDQENIDNLKSRLIKGYNLNKTPNSIEYRITQGRTGGKPNYYIDSLKDLNLWGHHSWEKFVPEIYKESSIEQRLDLLRGLMDTDGTVNYKIKGSGSVSYSTSSHKLALDVQYLVRSLGGLCKITFKKPFYTYKGIRKQGRTSFKCNIRHDFPETLMNLTRKKERSVRHKDTTLRCEIKSIKYIGMQETQCIMIDHPDHLYITDNFIVTHNSAFVAMCANYQLHRYLKLPNPSHYFNVLRNQALHMTFVAITYSQAEFTLWQPFRSFYDECSWFKEYNELLDFYALKHGLELYKNKDTFLKYYHKGLFCYASGPDKRKLRGCTRFFCAVDELGWFHGTEKAIKLNPDQVCQSLERSLRTVRSASNLKRKQLNHYNSPEGLFVNISSPSAANDKIMRLVRNKTIPTRYCFHLPTWEMNPNITREDLEAEYQDDPIGAERDYGANPPLSDSPYISNPDVLRILIGKYKNRCKYETSYEIDRTQHMTIKIKKFTFKPLDSGINYVIGVDTGHTKNAFAVVLQHYDLATNSAIVDMMIEVRPNDSSSVHFPSMFKKIIEPLVDNVHIGLVVFDKWQSINYEQELHDKGIESVRYSMKHEDFTNIRGLMFSRKLIIPIPEIPFNELINPSKDYHSMIENKPISHFIYQILTVRDLGRTVAKGLGVDDDIFRAWCLGVRFLFDKKYEKIFHQAYLSKKRKICVGVTFGKSANTALNSQLIRMNSKIVRGSGNKTLGTIQCKKGLK